MDVTILSDVPVSPNFAGGQTDVVCAFGAATELTDTSLLCVYRSGSPKHSADGRLMVQHSSDAGLTWSDPSVLLVSSNRDPVWSPLCQACAQTATGAVVAVMGMVEGLAERQYMFDDAGRVLPVRTLAARSRAGDERPSRRATEHPSAAVA